MCFAPAKQHVQRIGGFHLYLALKCRQVMSNLTIFARWSRLLCARPSCGPVAQDTSSAVAKASSQSYSKLLRLTALLGERVHCAKPTWNLKLSPLNKIIYEEPSFRFCVSLARCRTSTVHLRGLGLSRSPSSREAAACGRCLQIRTWEMLRSTSTAASDLTLLTD